MENTRRDYARDIGSGNYNDYRKPWMQARNAVSIKSETYTKDNDFTFSLGRPTNRREVANILMNSGACGSFKEITEMFTYMSINNNANENGQVSIQCAKPGIAEQVVEMLNDMNMSGFQIKRCHSYKIHEVPVKISNLHPSLNIKRDLIDKLLSKHGKVKSWHPTIDPLLKLLTGEYTFIMFEDDLKNNPLPMTIFMNGVPCPVYYKSRPKTCFHCGKTGHLKSQCPDREEEDSKCWKCGEEGHIKRNCPQNEDPSEKRNSVSSMPDNEEFPNVASANGSTKQQSVFLNGKLPGREIDPNSTTVPIKDDGKVKSMAMAKQVMSMVHETTDEEMMKIIEEVTQELKVENNSSSENELGKENANTEPADGVRDDEKSDLGGNEKDESSSDESEKIMDVDPKGGKKRKLDENKSTEKHLKREESGGTRTIVKPSKLKGNVGTEEAVILPATVKTTQELDNLMAFTTNWAEEEIDILSQSIQLANLENVLKPTNNAISSNNGT